jgi:hypothetical protein
MWVFSWLAPLQRAQTLIKSGHVKSGHLLHGQRARFPVKRQGSFGLIDAL